MRTILTLVLFSILTTSYAQISEEIQREKDRIERLHQDYLEKHQQQNNAPNSIPDAASQVREMLDSDDDGMDDQWEIDNGFDPNDRTDAYMDRDGDFVKNMFEYQLSTDPDSPTDPQIINYDPNTMTLSELLSMGDGGLVVIRMAGGDYNETHIRFSDNDTRIMLQGGWNADFTDHNPENYPTRIIGNMDGEVLYFSNSSSSEDFIENYILILEGLEVREGAGTFGNINFIATDIANQVLCLYNCKSTNSETTGMTFHHWTETGGKVYLVNSEFTNNATRGLYNQTTYSSNGDWRFYNVTVSGNGIGLRTFTLSAEVTFKAINTILLQNQNDFDVGNNYTVEMLNSNYNSNGIGNTNLTETNVIEADAQFLAPLNGDYELAGTSPCIDTGLDIGLPYSGSDPDMGAHEFGGIFSSSVDVSSSQSQFKVLPNLLREGQMIQIEYSLDSDLNSVALQIYDVSGVRMQSVDLEFLQDRTSIQNNLKAGMYVAHITSAGITLATQKFVVF